MITSWRGVEINGDNKDHVLVKYVDDGVEKMRNFNIKELVEQRLGITTFPAPAPLGGDGASMSQGVFMIGTAYGFKKGAVLQAHAHPAETLHTIEVDEGRVMVRRSASGDLVAVKGDTVKLAAGETHSVEAIEPSRTIHWLLAGLKAAFG